VIMSTLTKRISIMVLTEDSGYDAYDTVLTLVKEMLKLLVPDVHTHRIHFTPLKEENARRAMRGTDWKSTKALLQPSIKLLIRSIITELLKDDGFVLYHIDGDCPWSEQASSENVSTFQKCMSQPIEAGVLEHLQKNQRAGEFEERMKRFRLLVPFYSIEAWLYQNTREAQHLCTEQGCGRCLEKVATWEQARASLDEVLRPKEELCLRSKHNAHLASSGFPTREVFDANASFTSAVMNLLDCKSLTSALERTYTVPPELPLPEQVPKGSG